MTLKRVFCVLLATYSFNAVSFAQTPTLAPAAPKIIQQTQSPAPLGSSSQEEKAVEPDAPTVPLGEPVAVKIPSGTPIEVEAVYTISSIDMKRGDLLSFRVLIPVVIDGVTVIEKDAIVTARVTLAKRGGHWGKAGKLAWSMEDVVAVDNTRIPLAPETRVRNSWSLESKDTNSEKVINEGRVTGTSHGGEIATKMIVTAAVMPLIAPIALMQGFRRGENAILPEGKRFVVLVRADSNVKAAALNR